MRPTPGPADSWAETAALEAGCRRSKALEKVRTSHDRRTTIHLSKNVSGSISRKRKATGDRSPSASEPSNLYRRRSRKSAKKCDRKKIAGTPGPAGGCGRGVLRNVRGRWCNDVPYEGL